MKNFLRLSNLMLAIVLLLSIDCGKSGSGGTIRVALTRGDRPGVSNFHSLEFDESTIAKELEKNPTKFPVPIPPGVSRVMFYAGRVFGLFEKVPGKSFALVTLDVNSNRDLTDDKPFEVPQVENWKDGIIIKIARHFSAPSPHTEWLPYRFWYEENPGPGGELQANVCVAPGYDYKGDFSLGGKEYSVYLHDGDQGGRFIREKQVNVIFTVRPKASEGKPGAGSAHRLFELIPINDSLYEVKAIAEDGSWIEFTASGLSATTLGKKAPDLGMTDAEGKSFRISDYKGKVLVLDFWYVWCKPCIAKFPAIKKMIESYSDKPLAAVGVNIDIPERVEQAKKVIADNGLSWRQVVEGKGEFLPVYQVYGRLPEHPMSFPIYVAIDEEGIARYSTNDFEKMGRFLEAHFRDPKGPGNTLFIPLAPTYDFEKKDSPITSVDFESPEAKILSEAGKLKLPSGLPDSARIGRMLNGIALVVFPASTSDKVQMILDADGNSDLTNDKVYEVPVLDAPIPDESMMANVEYRIYYKSGAMGGGSFPFFARPSGEVYFKGTISDFAGSFFGGREEYRVELTDPDGDRVLTKADWSTPGLLKLKVKKGESWVEIHEGTSGIPIGRALYRVRNIYDDGYLVELEKEK